MDTLHHLGVLRAQLARWRALGQRIALVPTMGNLHAGHIELVREARRRAERVVVSIFVNPTQFGAGEDYASYPRTLAEDSAKLAEAGTDLLFAPTPEALYPGGWGETTRIEVPALSGILCGAFRPVHFSGVATVVAKLFNAVQPEVALFGEKDHQQLLVIRRLVLDLCFPIEIVGVPTVRESDGLAMSSRNGYLSPPEREIAPRLYQALLQARARLLGGERDYAAIRQAGLQALQEAGFRPEYFEVRDARSLAEPSDSDRELVILAAAWLGRARLIDNVRLGREDER